MKLRGVLLCAVAAAAAAELALLCFFNPEESSFFPPCLFHSATGLKCPGCGSQRAIYLLLHGRFADSLRMCPFLYFFSGVLLAMVAFPKRTATFGFGVAVVAASLVYAGLRMASIVP